MSYIGVRDAARLLGVGVKTVYRLVEMRSVPHYRVGSLIRFDGDELKRWMCEKNRVGEVTV